MAKQTIGGFISALRKANGMTQKELAFKLNVSDKAVSRWENNESYPDLMLVPVIADIFDITTDELLSGERNKVESEITCKKSKNIELMLKHSLSYFKNKIYISLGISALGLALALIINFSALESFLAFGIAVLFMVIAAVCHTIFLNQALMTVNSFDEENDLIDNYKRRIIDKIILVYSIILSVAIFCLPLAIQGGGRYGLDFPEWIYPGAIITVIYYIILILTNSIFSLKTKKYEFNDTQKHNAKLKIKIITAWCLIVGLSIITMLVLNNQITFVKGTEFKTQIEFVEFMETYKNQNNDIASGNDIFDDAVWDSDGNIIFSYPINDNVATIKWNKNNSDTADSYFPCTVYTDDDWSLRGSIVDAINIVFIVIYIFESVVPFAIYSRKKR